MSLYAKTGVSSTLFKEAAFRLAALESWRERVFTTGSRACMKTTFGKRSSYFETSKIAMVGYFR
jgi:hypothetical protein